MIREPAVAGTFYTASPARLKKEVLELLEVGQVRSPIPAIGVVSPHAGYIYSGHVTGEVLGRVRIPEKVVILCPNHTGLGAYASINRAGVWRTPLGDVPIEEALARRLMELDPQLEEDSLAHAREHALEVQLPFLQTLRPDLSMVPLCLGHFPYRDCERLGAALAQAVAESADPILMVASSDMNHYESQERTLQKDQRAIDCILALDPKALYDRVHEEHITMCGIIPTTCMLIAAQALGAKEATLVK
ncbi:MAG: AmmeMemoRadiSam system protein B, partial [Candidatus Binatia bacterium]